jgi:transposase-like protein
MSERSVPFYCPYCGEEDLRPHGATHGEWECRSCRRVFTVSFKGLLPPHPGPQEGR